MYVCKAALTRVHKHVCTIRTPGSRAGTRNTTYILPPTPDVEVTDVHHRH